jgi:hypothetical protein
MHSNAYEDGSDSVPKRLLLNTTRRTTTQNIMHDTKRGESLKK